MVEIIQSEEWRVKEPSTLSILKYMVFFVPDTMFRKCLKNNDSHHLLSSYNQSKAGVR